MPTTRASGQITRTQTWVRLAWVYPIHSYTLTASGRRDQGDPSWSGVLQQSLQLSPLLALGRKHGGGALAALSPVKSVQVGQGRVLVPGRHHRAHVRPLVNLAPSCRTRQWQRTRRPTTLGRHALVHRAMRLVVPQLGLFVQHGQINHEPVQVPRHPHLHPVRLRLVLLSLVPRHSRAFVPDERTHAHRRRLEPCAHLLHRRWQRRWHARPHRHPQGEPPHAPRHPHHELLPSRRARLQQHGHRTRARQHGTHHQGRSPASSSSLMPQN